MENKSKIICPYCGRKHSILRKDGELRKEIHCRCRDWTKGHTLISWIAGAGYHVFDKDMNMIPVMDDYYTLTKEEIVEDCQGILDMLNREK